MLSKKCKFFTKPHDTLLFHHFSAIITELILGRVKLTLTIRIDYELDTK